MFNYPLLVVFPFSLLAMLLAARIGIFVRRRRPLQEDEREEFGFVQAAALTLLGLIIGFSFSMAIGRYDQRKNYEEAEANSIGTEYLRVGLLSPTMSAKEQTLLKKYLDMRIQLYRNRNEGELQKINANTTQLQAEMWSLVQDSALAQPTPVMALVVSGMNDVLNSQGYIQAAWWNRIPPEAWALMIAIAFLCNLLVGYAGRSARQKSGTIFILPLFVAISFLLIADIDSPRGGLIHVSPQNLVSLSQSLE